MIYVLTEIRDEYIFNIYQTDEDEIDSSSRNHAYSAHRNTGELESSTTDSSPYRTYRSRWYILALFSAMCCLQVCMIYLILSFISNLFNVFNSSKVFRDIL